MLLAIVVGIIVAICVLGGFEVRDRVALHVSHLPKQSIGSMPPKLVSLNNVGRMQLRTAIQLVTRLQNSAVLEAETDDLAKTWLEQCAGSSDEPQLLQEASVLLLQIEAQEKLLGMLGTTQQAQVHEWLNGYLSRKELEQ